MKISFIIFCYNEQDTIREVFNDCLNVANVMCEEYEIILVNDGSTDSTGKICDDLSRENSNTKTISHPLNLGIGMALRSGYNAATKEFICAIPGDAQFDVHELLVTKPFQTNVYYSFYRPQTNYTLYRKILNWANRLFNQHMLAVYLRDVNWIKVYRKEHLELTNPQLNSSLIESEICAKLYKSNIVPIEIPSNYLPRKGGQSKGGSWKTLRKAIAETTKLWWVVFNFKHSKPKLAQKQSAY